MRCTHTSKSMGALGTAWAASQPPGTHEVHPRIKIAATGRSYRSCGLQHRAKGLPERPALSTVLSVQHVLN